jgi:hypothetical protein
MSINRVAAQSSAGVLDKSLVPQVLKKTSPNFSLSLSYSSGFRSRQRQRVERSTAFLGSGSGGLG